VSVRGAVTPFELLSTCRRLQNELRGLERFKYSNSCVTSENPIFLITKCINIKQRELNILRKIIN
jgi:hypothetical protein